MVQVSSLSPGDSLVWFLEKTFLVRIDNVNDTFVSHAGYLPVPHTPHNGQKKNYTTTTTNYFSSDVFTKREYVIKLSEAIPVHTRYQLVIQLHSITWKALYFFSSVAVV